MAHYDNLKSGIGIRFFFIQIYAGKCGENMVNQISKFDQYYFKYNSQFHDYFILTFTWNTKLYTLLILNAGVEIKLKL